MNARGTFCGNLTGNAQVLGTSPADAIDLSGSTFGTAAIKNGALPSPVSHCPIAK
jgi:hypothetical protein